MTPEQLRTETDIAEEAELQSDAQLRLLTSLIDKASGPNATVSAADCAKIIGAALALNERFRERTDKLRGELRIALLPRFQVPKQKA